LRFARRVGARDVIVVARPRRDLVPSTRGAGDRRRSASSDNPRSPSNLHSVDAALWRWCAAPSC
jgi:hypothetical protein